MIPIKYVHFFWINHLEFTLVSHRETASKYLKQLETLGIAESIKIKNSKFYINVELFARLKKGI